MPLTTLTVKERRALAELLRDLNAVTERIADSGQPEQAAVDWEHLSDRIQAMRLQLFEEE